MGRARGRGGGGTVCNRDYPQEGLGVPAYTLRSSNSERFWRQQALTTSKPRVSSGRAKASSWTERHPGWSRGF